MECIIISCDGDISEMLSAELSCGFHVSVMQSCRNACADLIVVDLDSAVMPEKYSGRILTFSRKERSTPNFILRPFLITDFLRACEEHDEKITVDSASRLVTVYGRNIILTETEYKLFSVLYENIGRYVPCDVLRKSVWGDEASDGVLNVYIHYLKTKIENGRKLIRSKRNVGYALIAD